MQIEAKKQQPAGKHKISRSKQSLIGTLSMNEVNSRIRRSESKRDKESSTLLVTRALFNGVALSTLHLEDLLSGFRVARWCFAEGRHCCAFSSSL